MSQTREQIREYLNSKLHERKKYINSLIVSADCQNNCLIRALKKKVICNSCDLKVNKKLTKLYAQPSQDFEDDISQIQVMAGLKGAFRGGKRFMLGFGFPVRSFRNLSKSKKRLRAYKAIVDFILREKGISEL